MGETTQTIDHQEYGQTRPTEAAGNLTLFLEQKKSCQTLFRNHARSNPLPISKPFNMALWDC